MSVLEVTDLPLDPALVGPAALVAAVREGEDWARAALYDRHAPDVARVLHAVLGPDQEVADLIQETFIEVFEAIETLRDVDALAGWMRQIAVNVARSCIRKRRRMRWLHVLGLTHVVEPAAVVAPPEARQAIAETYRVLGELPLDLRVAFSLRHIDGLELTDVALACGVSLATIKRRLTAAEESFRRHARRGGKLDEWLDAGRRTS
ncbi:MAG TPA: sigma-70 family RNA polymerase sigma factor [Labilithrix sp.]|nr:sigma-70 family RNA polymerase sigma factor [Labilithrix sp.]